MKTESEYINGSLYVRLLELWKVAQRRLIKANPVIFSQCVLSIFYSVAVRLKQNIGGKQYSIETIIQIARYRMKINFSVTTNVVNSPSQGQRVAPETCPLHMRIVKNNAVWRIIA